MQPDLPDAHPRDLGGPVLRGRLDDLVVDFTEVARGRRRVEFVFRLQAGGRAV